MPLKLKRHQKKNKTIKKNQLKKNQKKNKTKKSRVKSSNKRQEGDGLGDLVVPVALVATRELLRPSLEKRIKNRNSKKKNKKQSGGFVRHHSRFIPFKQELESNVMSVDDKIKSSIE